MPHAFALIHEENGVFGISFPDFPGCISTGSSVEEVMAKGRDALNFHVAGMVEDGDALPRLRSARELQDDLRYDLSVETPALATLIAFDVPGRAVRVNVSIEEALLQAIDRAAEAAGQSRSAFLAEAARLRIRNAA
jgi:predicted RNase H-like HicB family nuclease